MIWVILIILLCSILGAGGGYYLYKNKKEVPLIITTLIPTFAPTTTQENEAEADDAETEDEETNETTMTPTTTLIPTTTMVPTTTMTPTTTMIPTTTMTPTTMIPTTTPTVVSPPKISSIAWQNKPGITAADAGGLIWGSTTGTSPWGKYYQFSCVNSSGNESTKTSVFGPAGFGNYKFPKIRVSADGSRPCSSTDTLKVYRGNTNTNLTPITVKAFDTTSAYNSSAVFYDDNI